MKPTQYLSNTGFSRHPRRFRLPQHIIQSIISSSLATVCCPFSRITFNLWVLSIKATRLCARTRTCTHTYTRAPRPDVIWNDKANTGFHTHSDIPQPGGLHRWNPVFTAHTIARPLFPTKYSATTTGVLSSPPTSHGCWQRARSGNTFTLHAMHWETCSHFTPSTGRHVLHYTSRMHCVTTLLPLGWWIHTMVNRQVVWNDHDHTHTHTHPCGSGGKGRNLLHWRGRKQEKTAE